MLCRVQLSVWRKQLKACECDGRSHWWERRATLGIVVNWQLVPNANTKFCGMLPGGSVLDLNHPCSLNCRCSKHYQRIYAQESMITIYKPIADPLRLSLPQRSPLISPVSSAAPLKSPLWKYLPLLSFKCPFHLGCWLSPSLSHPLRREKLARLLYRMLERVD